MSIKDKYGLTDDQMHNVLERTQESFEKVGMSDALKTGLGVAGMSLASAGVAYAIPAAVEAVRESRVRRNRDEYIANMTKVFPEIKSIPKSDLHTAYNSLAMHSPHVLSDPLLGGQTLKSMANYRQADISALNEINKLRGGSLTDQALLNASNIAAGGLTEGYKTYVQQRDAAAEQKYREGQDTKRYDQQERHFKETYDQRRDQFTEQQGAKKEQFDDQQRAQKAQFDAQQQQREDHFAASFEQRETQFANEDAYKADRDAVADAKWQAEQAIRGAKNTREELSLIKSHTTMTEALNADGSQKTDDQGRPLYHSYQPGEQHARNTFEGHAPFINNTYHLGIPGTHPTRKPSTYPKKTTKTASAADMLDIVTRLRDRNS